MRIGKIAANAGLYTAGVIISCGLTQIYGLIKIVVDLIKSAHLHRRLARLDASEEARRRWGVLKYADKISHLKHDIKACHQALKASGVSLIPLVAGLFYWRVLAPKKDRWSPDAIRGIPYATSHLFADFKPLFLRGFYPYRSPAKKQPTGLNKDLWQSKGRVEIPVVVRKETLEALYLKHPTEEGKTSKPTVVFFHGNMQTAKSDYYDVGMTYFEKGFDVLLPTMGGYPGARGDFKTSEATTLQDVEAVRQFLVKSGVKKVGYHGYSIGSTLAFQAAASWNVKPPLKTCFVVGETPLVSGEEVAANLIKNFGLPGLAPLARGIALAAFSKKKKVLIASNEWVTTDGLDNLGKIKKLIELNIPLLCIHATHDILMSRARPKCGGRDFAVDLLRARYGEGKSHPHLFVLKNGTHLTRLFRKRCAETGRFFETLNSLS